MATDKESERTYKAVANRRRIAILRHLHSGGATVGELARAIRLSVKATSKHMQILAASGFVQSEQQGLYVHYSLGAHSETQRILKNLFH